MRNLLVSFLAALLLSCVASTADAGFVVKNSTVAVAASASKTATSANAVITSEKHNSFFSWLHPYGRGGRREARIAFFFAMWGLLFAPLGILAIIHGALSLKRARGRDDGLAITSIVIGSIEVLALIFFLFFFFFFFI